MNIPGAAAESQVWDKAQERAAELLEELKAAVKAETKDIGVLRKEMRITVPAKVIADHLEHNYDELVHDAFVPGFRKGRAPRRLVEKRYGADVRESLTTAIIGQSFYAAAENEKLETLGDPLFRVEADGGVKLVDLSQALEHLKLPEGSDDFNYTCEVELRPTFELPDLKNIPIKAPRVQIDDAMVEAEILRYRKNRGRYEPVEQAAEQDDQVIADVVLTCDGNEVKREDNLTLGVRPTRLDGVKLDNLAEVFRGVKRGETRTTEAPLPNDYERADLRGKTAQFGFTVHEVKRLQPEPLESFIQAMGFDNEGALRDDVHEGMERERDRLVSRAKRIQVEDYLLEKTAIELPADFSARQTDRAVVRRVIELQTQGVPMSDIERHIDELRTSAKEQVARDLRLGFILTKVAEQLEVSVTDEEVNTQIALMARQYGQRFDRIRDDLQKRGLLEQLVEEIRHTKCIDQLLADAQLDETASDAT